MIQAYAAALEARVHDGGNPQVFGRTVRSALNDDVSCKPT